MSPVFTQGVLDLLFSGPSLLYLLTRFTLSVVRLLGHYPTTPPTGSFLFPRLLFLPYVVGLDGFRTESGTKRWFGTRPTKSVDSESQGQTLYHINSLVYSNPYSFHEPFTTSGRVHSRAPTTFVPLTRPLGSVRRRDETGVLRS